MGGGERSRGGGRYFARLGGGSRAGARSLQIVSIILPLRAKHRTPMLEFERLYAWLMPEDVAALRRCGWPGRLSLKHLAGYEHAGLNMHTCAIFDVPILYICREIGTHVFLRGLKVPS